MLRILSVFLLLCLVSQINGRAQGFELVNAGFVGVGRSSVAWADYDKDGDLDLLLSGNTGSGPYVTAVYRNDNGTFININAGLTGIDNSSVAWGDYDNDGDPDILATGRSNGSTKTWLYRNDNGTFISVSTSFPDVGSYGSVCWGDIDGDNDLDAVISGNYASKLFKNINGSFSEESVSLPGVSNCWNNMGDYDNDGDIDIFIMGDVGGWPISAICKNEDGFFFEMDSTGIMPLSGGSASWCDYDNDRDLDVLVEGFDLYLEPKTYIFRNDGDMAFTNTWPGLPGAALGTAAWGDYDNDGDADVLITGQNAACGSLSSLIFRNDGNDNFMDINAPLDGAERGSADWGDYDNDGDLDIVISGFNGSGLPVTKLYRNTSHSNIYAANVAPGIPISLSTSLNNHQVTLNWQRSNDNNTPSEAITYNLKVGNCSGCQNVLSANVDITGNLLLPSPGNVGNDTSWMLNLPDGNYYWSVQALDHSFANSAFSEEQQFSITNVGLDTRDEKLEISISPNPFRDILQISTPEPCLVRIFNQEGKCIFQDQLNGSTQLYTTHWVSGLYYINVSGSKCRFTKRIVMK